MPPVDPNTVSRFRNSEHIPDHYWQELSALDPDDVCQRALVSFQAGRGYQILFLNQAVCLPPRSNPDPKDGQP